MDDFEPPLICKTTTVGMVIVQEPIVLSSNWPTMQQNADISTSNFENFLWSVSQTSFWVLAFSCSQELYCFYLMPETCIS